MGLGAARDGHLTCNEKISPIRIRNAPQNQRNKNCQTLIICWFEFFLYIYNKNIMKCKNCECKDAVRYSKYSNGEFCCKECARAYSTKNKRKEINKKVSNKLVGKVFTERYLKKEEKNCMKKGIYQKIEYECKICQNCKEVFLSGSKTSKSSHKRKFCSLKCAREYTNKSYKKRNSQSFKMLEKAMNGTIKNKAIKCKYFFKEKMIVCDSKVEYSCLDFFEKKYKVIDINRSDVIIEYEYEKTIRRYNPDFLITTSIGVFLVECKTFIKNKFLDDKWRKYNEISKIKKEKLEIYAKENNMESFWFTKELHRKFYDSLKNRKDILL